LFRIINTEVYLTQDDGIFTETADSIELVNSRIHDVNQLWFTNQDQTVSGGDAFQMVNIKWCWVHSCKIDHSATGNKFDIIFGGDGTVKCTGIIENDTLIDGTNNIAVYIGSTNTCTIRNNKFQTNQIAIYDMASNCLITGNEFINTSGTLIMLGASTGSVTNFTYNTLYNIGTFSNGPATSLICNYNIFYKVGTLFSGNISADYNDYYNVTNATGTLGTHSLKVDPLFTNVGTDFTLKANSPCLTWGSHTGTVNPPIVVVNKDSIITSLNSKIVSLNGIITSLNSALLNANNVINSQNSTISNINNKLASDSLNKANFKSSINSLINKF
jgi:hypothetical protein